MGWAPGGYADYQIEEISSPGLSFSEKTGFSEYVTDDIISCKSKATLERGSSSWTLKIRVRK
ncbi:MAG: hypothetical protein N4A40_13080 [Tissierellales bacterium]|jgi:hypothetical protein|nr:hypothetical protein [Tissierellales bacterium]